MNTFRNNNSQIENTMNMTMDMGLTMEQLKAVVGDSGEVYPFACPRCGEMHNLGIYFGSKKKAYWCMSCDCLFWQDGDGKPYEVNDCD